jgi:hypothetical protein
MRPGRVVIAAAFIVVLAVGGWLVYSRSSLLPTSLGVSTTLTEERVSFLEAGLNSRDKSEQKKVLAPSLRSGEWSSAATLPIGATVTLDRASFVTDGMGSAHVNATVKGSASAEFVLTLASIDDQWFIVTSIKK